MAEPEPYKIRTFTGELQAGELYHYDSWETYHTKELAFWALLELQATRPSYNFVLVPYAQVLRERFIIQAGKGGLHEYRRSLQA